jgi:hypothetical protein
MLFELMFFRFIDTQNWVIRAAGTIHLNEYISSTLFGVGSGEGEGLASPIPGWGA